MIICAAGKISPPSPVHFCEVSYDINEKNDERKNFLSSRKILFFAPPSEKSSSMMMVRGKTLNILRGRETAGKEMKNGKDKKKINRRGQEDDPQNNQAREKSGVLG